MGIIKTAILGGVGVYGIKQLAKSQESRHSGPSPNDYPRDNYNYPPQGAGYWGPPGPPPRQGPREDYYYSENPNQQQRQWYPAQGQASNQYARGYAADYEDEKYTSQAGEVVYQARDRGYNTPPPYGAQQGYQQQASPYEPRRSSPAVGPAGLLGPAMEFVGNQQSGKKGNKGKASDIIGEVLSK